VISIGRYSMWRILSASSSRTARFGAALSRAVASSNVLLLAATLPLTALIESAALMKAVGMHVAIADAKILQAPSFVRFNLSLQPTRTRYAGLVG
jgi:hypothetical protein